MLDYTYHNVPLSLYNISKYMLGYTKLDETVHKVWCEKLEHQREYYKRILKLKPRGTYKTTIYTVSQCIELLMKDWLDNNSECFDKRLLIASATEGLATQILGEISTHFVQNPSIKQFFEYDPVRSSKYGELWLEPKSIHKEPTIKAIGSGTAIVSEHYDIIFCDDIVNSEDRESKAKRDRNWRWYQDVISILEPKGYLGVWGTRWHFDDVYNHLFEQNKKLPPNKTYIVEVESAVDEITGKSLFPTVLTDEEIAGLKIEKGLVEFYAQYLNKCIPLETQLFPLERMHFYPEYGEKSDDYFSDYHKNFLYCDPALGKTEKGDYVIILAGTAYKNKLFIRDCYLSNTTTPLKASYIAEQMMDTYDIGYLHLESNGFQTLYGRDFVERGISIIEHRNQKNKEVRIEGLEPYVSSGKILFREDWQLAYPSLIEQLNMYPATEHDDAPDALESLTQIALGKGVKNYNGETFASGISRSRKPIYGRPHR